MTAADEKELRHERDELRAKIRGIEQRARAAIVVGRWREVKDLSEDILRLTAELEIERTDPAPRNIVRRRIVAKG